MLYHILLNESSTYLYMYGYIYIYWYTYIHIYQARERSYGACWCDYNIWNFTSFKTPILMLYYPPIKWIMYIFLHVWIYIYIYIDTCIYTYIRQGKGLMVLAGATTNSETLLHLKLLFQCYITPLLNELRGGDRHTLSIHEIMKNFPQEYINRLVFC
jgi:hypothetical protein